MTGVSVLPFLCIQRKKRGSECFSSEFILNLLIIKKSLVPDNSGSKIS